MAIITTNLTHRQVQDGEDLTAAPPLMNAISRIPRTTTNLVNWTNNRMHMGVDPTAAHLALIMNVITRIPRATIYTNTVTLATGKLYIYI